MAAPTVTPLVESFHNLGFLVSEDNGHRSREQITIKAGLDLKAGTVLGKITVSAAAPVYAATGGNTGNFTASAVAESAGAIVGVYQIEFTAATVFNVTDPNGAFVGEGHTGVAFAKGGLGFTLTAGGTPAVAGDSGTITVVANADAGKYAAFDPTAAIGTQNASAILGYDTFAASVDKQAMAMVRACEVNASELVWGANVTTTPQKTAATAQLTAVGIISR